MFQLEKFCNSLRGSRSEGVVFNFDESTITMLLQRHFFVQSGSYPEAKVLSSIDYLRYFIFLNMPILLVYE